MWFLNSLSTGEFLTNNYTINIVFLFMAAELCYFFFFNKLGENYIQR